MFCLWVLSRLSFTSNSIDQPCLRDRLIVNNTQENETRSDGFFLSSSATVKKKEKENFRGREGELSRNVSWIDALERNNINPKWLIVVEIEDTDASGK
jgi:hypothetical protein